jgi:uncharacterized SAM-binding protein YcdF (DUF218 family)
LTRVLAVLGYSDGRGNGLHPICAARVARGTSLAPDVEAVLLSGWARRHGAPSEAELMRAAWNGGGPEALTDPVSRTTAESAARVAALARDLGAGRVELVTSWWHAPRTWLLARAALAGSGVRVSVHRVPGPCPPRLLLRELAAYLVLPLQVVAIRRRLGADAQRSSGL